MKEVPRILCLWLVTALSACGGGGEAQAGNPGSGGASAGSNNGGRAGSSSGGVFYLDGANDRFYHVTLGGEERPIEISDPQVGTDFFVSYLNGYKRFATLARRSSTLGLLTLYESATLKPLLSVEVPRYTDVYGPVFGNPDWYALKTDQKIYLSNLKIGSIIKTLATVGPSAKISVLPDGRLHLVSEAGQISIVSQSGAITPQGQLAIPQGRTISSVRMNNAGTRMAIVYFTSVASGLHSDVWMANADGSGQVRVTQNDEVRNPVWSPDDRQLVVTLDYLTPRGLGSTYVDGHCGLWLIPADARTLAPFVFGVAHPVAKEMMVSGIRRCGLSAWHAQ